jgi:hypothetical protein
VGVEVGGVTVGGTGVGVGVGGVTLVEPVLARFCGFGLYFSPEIFVHNPFAFSYLLFGNIKNAFEFGRIC